MTDPPAPDRDVDALMRRQRERIAAQRRRTAGAGDRTGSGGAEAVEPDAVALSLEQAATVADVGTALPPLGHLGPLRRAVARLTGRVVLYFLRLITLDQRQYNRLVLRAIAGLRAQIADALSAEDAVRHRLGSLEATLTECHRGLRETGATLARFERRTDEIASALAARADELTRLAAQDGARNRHLAELQRGLNTLRAEADRRALRLAMEAQERPAAPGPAESDEFVVDRWLVSEAFRGSEAELMERQRRYLPCFEGRRDVLDIGCGRGEFLQLLKEAGVSARGVDIDRDMALWCQEKGLDVVCMDALAYLADLKDASLGGIFCAQVVEHLTTSNLLRLLHLAYRKLRPDGLLLIETLNPESLFVLYRWFWVDLTHERLVHPETLKFVLQSCGFRNTECRFVPLPDGPLRIPPLRIAHESPEELQQFNAATTYLNDLLYGSFDYAVIATR